MNNIPILELSNGVKIPAIGNGPAAVGYTPKLQKQYSGIKGFANRAYRRFISRPILERNYIDAVANSFKIGFTLLDNSAAYRNEEYIYRAIQKSGINRKDLFITTRCSNQAQFRSTVRDEFFNSLKALHTDYVDLYQFHWPVTNHYVDTWNEIIKLYKEGYCRSIGVANCHQHHIETLIKSSNFVPHINQFEVHPLFTQKTLIDFCNSKNIQVEAYTAIARFDDRLMRLPLLKNIANQYNKTVVQVILRWHIQNGVIPLVRSLNPTRQLENISIFDFELTKEEIDAIDSININARVRYDPDNCDFTIL